MKILAAIFFAVLALHVVLFVAEVALRFWLRRLMRRNEQLREELALLEDRMPNKLLA